MDRSSSILALAAITAFVLLGASPAPIAGAQPAVDDLVFADATVPNQGTILVRDAIGNFSTLASMPAFFPNWITMADDNASLAATFVNGNTYADGLLARVTAAGVVTTVTLHGSTISFGNGHIFEGDGTIITAHNSGVLTRYDASLQSLAAFAAMPRAPNNLTLNRDDGDYYVVAYEPSLPFRGSLLSYDPRRRVRTTLLGFTPTISQPSDVAYDPATGQLMIARFDAPGILRYNATNRTLTSIWQGANANTVVPTARGTFLVLSANAMYEITGTGQTTRTVALLNRQPTSVTEWGNRRIFLAGVPIAGGAVQISIQSPRPSDANKAYGIAASFALRPALGPFGGDRLYLTPDGLFFASVSGIIPQVFQNFSGTLDASAHATATLALPQQLGTGWNLPVHIGGLVLDPNAPSGVTTVLSSATFTLL